MAQDIIIPIDSDGFIVKSSESGTYHYVQITSQPKQNRTNPILLVEVRKKGSAIYETIESFKIGVDKGFNFTAPVEEYRFTVKGGDDCGIINLYMKDTVVDGDNDNANLNTELMDKFLSDEDYLGSFTSLADLNNTRSGSPTTAWAVVTDGTSANIAYSNGSVFALMQQSGPTEEEVLLEGIASGFLYVNQLEAG